MQVVKCNLEENNVAENGFVQQMANYLKKVQSNTEKLNKFMSFMCHFLTPL